MSDVRQLPLFPDQPASPDDLNRHSPFKHTLALFQTHLMQSGKTEHTVKAFTSDLHLLAERAGEATAIGEFTTTTLSDFMRWLEHGRGIPCSRKSYARRVTTLKVYFKWLHEIGAIPYDPAVPILQRSGQAPLADILDERETAMALSYADTLRIAEKPDARPALILRLLLATGIKKAEAARLSPKDVLRIAKGQAILLVKHSSPKDVYKERRIEIDGELLDVLDEYLGQYRVEDTLFTCTPRNLEYILADIGVGAGLDKKPSFEMLRWMAALRDYQAGMDADAIREKLGLSKISWVETFAKIKRLAGEDAEELEVDE